jgi:hypothetical protein
VSPTVFRAGGLRFFFFSREETRLHVHVMGSGGEAKFWIEPKIELAQNYGMSRRSLASALRLIREHEREIRTAWKAHFGR